MRNSKCAGRLTLTAVAALSVLGCASHGSSEAEPTAATGPLPGFERAIAPFEVIDSTGRAYSFPFLGGYNLPRPQLIDIDADGDDDLFVQELSGRISFFERVAGSGAFEWRTDEFAGLEVGEWYRFTDMDGDGDYDLLAESPFSYISYYRNDGSAAQPRFTLAVDTLRDSDGEAIFSDRQNIPNVGDIDCDNLPDLFLGRVEGTITHYESEGLDADDVPRFRLVTDRFEDIEIVAQFGSLHGANTLTLVDIDLDGDSDLFWGDFFEPGLLFIENTGSTCAAPALRDEPEPFPPNDPIETSGYNAPAFGDVDGDGDVDLLAGVIGGAFNLNRTSAENLYYLEQASPLAFELRTRRFVTQIDVGNESIPAFVDLDGDGDQDMLLANKIEPRELDTSRVYELENVGSARAPRFRLEGVLAELEGDYHYAPAFGDLDADGDLDMVLGVWKRELAFYRNDGSAQAADFVLEDAALIELTRGSNATPALADLDADGDLDLLIGEASGTINYYRNVGSPQSPAFELVSDEFSGIDVGRRSSPALADLDRDGDLDLFIGRDAGGLAIYRNDGSHEVPSFVPAGELSFPPAGLSAPAFVDLDGDGDLDLVAGGFGGGLFYYENGG